MTEYKFIETKCCYTCKNKIYNGDSIECSKGIAFITMRTNTGIKLFKETIGLTHEDTILHVCDLHEFDETLVMSIK